MFEFQKSKQELKWTKIILTEFVLSNLEYIHV